MLDIGNSAQLGPYERKLSLENRVNSVNPEMGIPSHAEKSAGVTTREETLHEIRHPNAKRG